MDDRGNRFRLLFVERIISVAMSVEGVERVAIVGIQRQPEPDTLWQVGIRQEKPPEGNQVGISFLYDFLRRSGFKPPAAMIVPLNIFRSRAAAIAYCPCATTTFPLTRVSWMSRY